MVTRVVQKSHRTTIQQHPIDDPQLQSRLKTKFGSQLLKEGFTGVPVLIQQYYRYVPGAALPQKDGTPGTYPSYMSPTEFALMVDIWSYWWNSDSQPWPSVTALANHLKKSKRMTQRHLDSLREKGFMLSLAQFNSEGRQLSNRYDFTPFLRKMIEYLEKVGVIDPPEEPDGIGGEGDTNVIQNRYIRIRST